MPVADTGFGLIFREIQPTKYLNPRKTYRTHYHLVGKCWPVAFVICAVWWAVAPDACAQESNETLARIQSNKILNWGADAEGGAPYVYLNPRNTEEFVGFEVDIADSLARRLGAQALMQQTSWDALVPGLLRKDFDIIMNGLEVTADRLRFISFSKPYFVYTQQLVTRKGEQRIKRFEDCAGKTVGTLSASVSMRLLEKLDNIEIRQYIGIVEQYRDLENGRLDAVLLDLPMAVFYAKNNPKLQFTGEPFAEGYYAIGVRKGDSVLLDSINAVLADMLDNGALDSICRKWGVWTPAQRKLRDLYPRKSDSSFAQNDERRSAGSLALGSVLPRLLSGAVMTVTLSVVSMVFAMLLGLILAMSRLYGVAPVRFVALAYIEVVRGTPLLIQMYLIYYGLPEVGIKLNAFTAAIMGLAMNYAAYEAENYRAGIQAIPRGQMEAAIVLGMTRWMALRKIIIPQAVRQVLPPVSNDFVALFKDSSIVSVISMVELTKEYNYLASTSYDYMGLGLITCALYFGMSYPVSLLARMLEKKKWQH